MNPLVLITVSAVVLLLVGGRLAAAAYRRKRRRCATRAAFPEAWVRILRSNLPPYTKLSFNLRNQLHRNIQIFLCEKSLEGCGGQVITDEVKVTIAAQACMLLLNRDVDCYPKMHSVLVYPSTYVVGGKSIFGGGHENKSVRLGETWRAGPVVLAWDSARQGALNFKDGRNLVMHEFAHQLDQEDGISDGAPILESRSAYSTWAKAFSREYEKLQRRVRKRKGSVIDAYGSTNRAEFFAVATEVFFEKPRQLMKKHRELYDELRGFYKVNPVEWT